ncbi:putative CENPB DNA-binding domain-containing protein 1 [Palaemon carinicauda]|uniref:putative CENPB DNA-binding domain-containing protein 1 n=1 Tax=Palaemon carinicauda TaxID=392227 RepID=UPI0035B5D267
MVGEKRKASSESGSAKKRQAISFETKVAIIKKLDTGEKMVSVARAYNLNRSTVGTIYKQKDHIIYDEKKKKTVQSSLDRFFRPVSSKSSKEDTHQPSSSSPRPSTSSYIEVTEEKVTFEAHPSDDEDPLMI